MLFFDNLSECFCRCADVIVYCCLLKTIWSELIHHLKLTYFDIPGGRAEPARLALHLGNIEFEDFRFSFDRFKEIIVTTPLKQVPTLLVDGVQITQCNAINRFAAKLAGFYPKDDYDALCCDEILEAVEDLTHKVVSTFGLENDELRLARENLVNGPMTLYLKWADSKLQAAGGEFFIDNRLTIADLKVFVWIRGLRSGKLDHVPTALVEEIAPKLNHHCERIASIPEIAEYYAR